MNKLVVVLSITIVILGIVNGFLFYQLQNQITEQETQLSKYTNLVKITEFSSSGFWPIVGVKIQSKANVTIENLGVNDVEGLTLTIKCSTDSGPGEAKSLAVLNSGEKRVISGYVYLTLDTIGWVTVTLRLGHVTIDEYIVPRFPNTQ
ncbi:MAG: hypothetical protein JSW14_00865 [Candidatus Bathyarchaeum sp.]|nr:MAG: hypothetical protein JSW14_00865 [Candidatus Bathyarchaeum sp.]